MKSFGLNQQSAAAMAPASFGASIDAAIASLNTIGLADDRETGVAFRTESAGSAALAASVSERASAMVRSIVDNLNFDQVAESSGQGQISTLRVENRALADKQLAAMRLRAEAAATIGYGLAVGHHAASEHSLKPFVGGNGAVAMPTSGGSLSMTLRQEAFNNIDVKRSVAFSMGFNAAITRQTDVVMAWYPPVFINPDQTTVEIALNVLTVFNGASHDISGQATKFARRNPARAFADPTVLNRFETQIVPVSRAENAAVLVDTAVVPHYDRLLGNRSVRTAPIKYDTDVNLLSLSTTAALLATGTQNQRDTIEPGGKLEAMWIKSGADIIKLSTVGLKTSNFIGAQQGDQQEVILNMRTKIGLGKTLTQASGAALAGPLKVLVDNDLRVKLSIQVSGTVNVETGNAKVNRPTITLVELVDGATLEPITSGATFTAVRDAIANLEHLGWDPRCYRTNANRRQTGDRINTRRFNFHYVVPYRDPITAERPAHKQEDQDAQDLQNLVALTRVRIENEVIDHIIETAETLKAYVDMRDTDAEPTDVMGLAQYYLVAAYAEKTLDLTNVVDSIKSSDRAKDIQAAFVVNLRDMASRLYTDSQFKAGTDIQSGGTLPVPQVNLLADPVVARYIFSEGELRTLGDFEMVLTTTLNYRVRDQIFMSFRMPGQESANEPCIFNFGHLFMSPELVLAANMTREGSYFAETQVQPRYSLEVMCPVMGRVYVSGVKEVLRKVPRITTLSGPHNVTGMEPLFPPAGP